MSCSHRILASHIARPPHFHSKRHVYLTAFRGFRLDCSPQESCKVYPELGFQVSVSLCVASGDVHHPEVGRARDSTRVGRIWRSSQSVWPTIKSCASFRLAWIPCVPHVPVFGGSFLANADHDSLLPSFVAVLNLKGLCSLEQVTTLATGRFRTT